MFGIKSRAGNHSFKTSVPNQEALSHFFPQVHHLYLIDFGLSKKSAAYAAYASWCFASGVGFVVEGTLTRSM